MLKVSSTKSDSAEVERYRSHRPGDHTAIIRLLSALRDGIRHMSKPA